MSSTPREIGTLIVVILRANHLPNKRSIGKQDPYCLATVNGEKRRTKAIKRGGQHPEWDEEIRFTLFEDVEDVLARTARGDATAPFPPPKDDKKNKKIKGGKTMKLACYADDPREPELIGETDVDLTEVLTKGETDDWFTLSNKDKFAGKVYIELTFWSNEPPPEKKVSHKPHKNKQYGGPGSFVPSGEPSSSQVSSSRVASAGFFDNHSRRSSDVFPIPSSLRASSSLGGLDLYVPPYERNRRPQMDTLVREFNEFGVSEHHPPASFPPVSASYTPQPHAALSSYPSYGYEQNIPEATSPYSYDRPLSPNVQMAHQHSPSENFHSYPSDGYLQNPYESTTYQPSSRGPRHSIPTASSGFMLLPQSSGFVPSHTSEPSGFAPPHSYTPAPMNYNPQPQQVYAPPLSHTPIPANNGPYLQQSTSLSFHPQQPFSDSQSFSYPSYGIPPSASAPPQQFLSSPPPASAVPQAHSAPPHIYPASPSQDDPSGQLLQSQNASRPLPQQPQVVYTQPALQTPNTMPQPGGISQLNTFGSTPVPNTMPVANNGFALIPPPPPPPILQYNANAPSVNAPHLPIPPPPPPPVPFTQNRQPVRRASLPQPPTTADGRQPIYQPAQPPPPPPLDFVTQNVPPPPPPLDTNHPNATCYPGHPPKPPVLVDEHGQWLQSTNTLSLGLHSSQGY